MLGKEKFISPKTFDHVSGDQFSQKGFSQKPLVASAYVEGRAEPLAEVTVFPELKLEADYTSFDLMDADLGRVLSVLRRTRTPRTTAVAA
jgi:hypothetical protein